MADDQSAFSTDIKVSFNGTDIDDKDVISFVVERDFEHLSDAGIARKRWLPAQPAHVEVR